MNYFIIDIDYLYFKIQNMNYYNEFKIYNINNMIINVIYY